MAPHGDIERSGEIEPEHFNGTNRMKVYVLSNDARAQALLLAVYDNLGKGASGAAVQNMNLMLGFEMTAGLALETPPAGSPASARSERT